LAAHLSTDTRFRYEFDDSVWYGRIDINYRFGG